ncbi:MAG: N-6 DNA methylase, partial [Gammaproteobacteria bacterium]|nr:N-6 DNA methylase [Gammaproteobacteria bacterium]
NGSMSSGQKDESAIRKNIINADLVDCMVALPGQLFYSTQIPACLWFLSRSKTAAKFRKRKGETLFIDARQCGEMETKVQRILTDAEVQRIAGAYHAWRGDKGAGKYADAPGFCRAVATEEIARHDYVLTPGRYVGAAAAEDDGVPFADKMKTLTAQLAAQMAEGKKLDRQIRANLKALGFPLDK